MTVTLTTLSNGLKIITDHIPTVETVSLGAWFHVGSRNETYDINGIAHMLEHMAFKGTTKRSAKQIAEEFESVGGYLNAYTSREITAYYARCLKGDLSLAVDILADILQNSTFDDVEFSREQGVILQEIGQSNDTPDDIVFDYFQEACFPNHPMGWPILGRQEVIMDLTPDRVQKYMKDHYSLSNMVFSAAGNLDHAKVVDLVETHFDTMTKNIPCILDSAHYTGGTVLVEKDLEQAHIILGFEGIPFGHPDYYALMVYTSMMGGGMSSRLFQEIREKRGLVYTIHAGSTRYRDSGLFQIYAGTSEKDAAQLVPLLCDELSNSVKGFEDTEINRAKAQLKAGLLMGLESTSNRCERIANQILNYGKVITPQAICNSIDKINHDDLKRISTHLLQSTPTLVGYGPVSKMPKEIHF